MELGKRWAEPHRTYHGIEHLRDVLDALELIAADGWPFDLELARRAAWFHDAVYDVRRDDNEERSAALAHRMLPAAMAEPVARLVLLTKDHVVEPGDAVGAALCDADLSILGSAPQRYARYCTEVRDEYDHVPDALYRRERTRVLLALLDHEPMYASEPGRVHWETEARDNVTKEVASLMG